MAAAAAVLSEEFFLSSFVFLFCFVHERIERSHTYIVIMMMMMKTALSPESEGCLCPSVSVCVRQRLEGGGGGGGLRQPAFNCYTSAVFKRAESRSPGVYPRERALFPLSAFLSPEVELSVPPFSPFFRDSEE